MFVNRMPRYEVLSEDAMAMLDKGWRRLMTEIGVEFMDCLLYTSPSPRDGLLSRMPSSA